MRISPVLVSSNSPTTAMSKPSHWIIHPRHQLYRLAPTYKMHPRRAFRYLDPANWLLRCRASRIKCVCRSWYFTFNIDETLYRLQGIALYPIPSTPLQSKMSSLPRKHTRHISMSRIRIPLSCKQHPIPCSLNIYQTNTITKPIATW